MHVPRGLAKLALAEVCLCLSKDWPIDQKDMRWATPEFFWPIRVLKQVARYPHLHETWLTEGHTIGRLERPEPLDPAGRFVGLILLEPMTFPKGAGQVLAHSGREIRYLALVPLLKEELAFKMENGSRALADQLKAARVTELLDVHRPSVIGV
jgi:Suppressor of fused protein (SUFU)